MAGSDARATPAVPPDTVETAWKEFCRFLRSRGARITQARRLVLEAVLGRHDHFRADDLAAELTRGRSRVSRGTVYRTLALMVEAGLVRKIRDKDTHSHYEHVIGHAHHEHMICDGCGKFIEFADKELQHALDRACREAGFRQRGHRVVIFGLCPDCREAGETAPPGPPEKEKKVDSRRKTS